MNTTARKTVAGAYAEIATLRTEIAALSSTSARILALLDPEAPAAVTQARKAPTKKTTTRKPAKKATTTKAPAKGAQTRETLSRKDWNRTLTTLAKTQPKGSGAYALVLASWDVVTEARDAGMTPREALSLVIG